MFGRICGVEHGTKSMKIDIIREMKLLAMILFLPVAALAVTVEPLPGFKLEVR